MAGAGVRWICAGLVAAAMWGAAGCSSGSFVHVWEDRYLVARGHQDRGEREAARGHYAQLLKAAPDGERKRLVELELALLLLDEGKKDEALAALDKLWEAEARDAHGARAMWEAALLRQGRGEGEQADKLREALITRYPGHVHAELALHDTRRAYVARGQAAALRERLTGMLAELGESGMGPLVLFVRAEVERDELGLPDAALATFEEVWALDEAGPLADDAVWERAELYRAREDWDKALVELGRLADPAESSWFVGSYDVEYADQARYDRGVIMLERKGDWRGARAEFERFLSDYKDSLLSDDAAWGVVRATWAGEGADAGREALKRFEEAYPESRYMRRAEAIRDGREVAP
jgi:tetratricopeptide (TPR) repeat protein